MNDTDYAAMIEIPVDTTEVVTKKRRFKLSGEDAKRRLMRAINRDMEEESEDNYVPETDSVSVTTAKKEKSRERGLKKSVAGDGEKGRFDIVAAQIAVVVALLLTVLLTNIFWHVNNEWDGEYIVSLESEGNGYVAVGFEVDPETWGAINFFEAVPQEGYRFVNWVDTDGNEISTDPRYEYEPRNAYEMIAVFVTDGSEPVVTEEPTEPIVTDEPTEPVVTDEPTEPITPDVPATGAVSLSVLGVAAILAGGIAVSKRKH